jgi:tetratricopeptide (TPR) repeat protein
MVAAWLHERREQRLPAIRHALHALALYDTLGDVDGQADASNLVGWQYALLGRPERGLAYCERALEHQQKLGYLYGEANTWDSLGYIHHRLGEHEEAADCYRHAVGIFNGAGDPRFEATSLDRLGDLHLDAANPVAARAAWTRALSILTDLHHPDATAVRAKLRRSAAPPPGEPAGRAHRDEGSAR